MCAVSDAGHLAVLLAGLVQALVTVDVDQRQLLHSTQTQAVCNRESVYVRLFILENLFNLFLLLIDEYTHLALTLKCVPAQ